MADADTDALADVADGLGLRFEFKFGFKFEFEFGVMFGVELGIPGSIPGGGGRGKYLQVHLLNWKQ